MRKLTNATLVVLLCAGCATTYEPDPSTYELEAIPEFRGSVGVGLSNLTTSSEVFLSSNGFERWYGDPRGFADAAIALIGRELESRGFRIEANAERTLDIAVTTLQGETSAGGFAFRVGLELRVRTRDGGERTFAGSNRSTYFARAADGAVMRAATALLSDPEVVAYLTR